MKRNKVLLATDVDDTLCNTAEFIINELLHNLSNRGKEEEFKYVLDNMDTVPTLLFRDDIKDIIFESIISRGDYMHLAKPSALLATGYDVLIREFKDEYPEHFTSVVCTHRGFTELGKNKTASWLNYHDVDDCFDEIHSIKSSLYPNKIEYLSALFPEHQILLLDDNPLHLPKETVPYIKELLIYDGITQLPGYENQTKFKDLTDLTTIIENLILSN